MLEMSQNSKHYKADEIATMLGVKKFVIRTWEKQFNLNRAGMQYSEEDLITFEAIRDMLYGEKLSPTVAKQQLPSVLAQKAEQIQSIAKSNIQEPAAEPILAEVAVQADQPEILEIKLEAKVETQELAQEIQAPEIVEFTPKITEPETFVEEQTAKPAEDDIVGATLSQELSAEDQVQPAFKQDQEFWDNIKSFKKQLLDIQERLK
ncbi:MAG: hypothetical protein US49_C0003G0079 [candidate division TM6 bacterium GW2011_GWF2_37_49]|nr:MAG: hypothetical protein US49_C0003G0079 [candidate division TM6 bacterium GW2011_GWF2_37_49]